MCRLLPSRSQVDQRAVANEFPQPPKQGRKSKADRAVEPSEFEQVISLLEGTQDYDKRYRFPTMIKTQFHFIARGDDISHMKKENVEACAEHPWTLTAKLRWSKNVTEERDCPKQIILGAADPQYCVLLALAIFEESWIETGGGVEGPWLFCDGDGTELVEVAGGDDEDEYEDDDNQDGDGNGKENRMCTSLESRETLLE